MVVCEKDFKMKVPSLYFLSADNRLQRRLTFGKTSSFFGKNAWVLLFCVSVFGLCGVRNYVRMANILVFLNVFFLAAIDLL